MLQLSKIELIIVWGLLFTLYPCLTTPLSEILPKEHAVLFVQDDILANQYNCVYKGIVQYTPAENPGRWVGCALHQTQAQFFIHQAVKREANLVVAHFSRHSDGASFIEGKPVCINEAKIFKCPQNSLIELRMYE